MTLPTVPRCSGKVSTEPLLRNDRGIHIKRESGEVVSDTTCGGGGGADETISPVLKVPRQCSLVLLIELM
jgi:hypothetical protein